MPSIVWTDLVCQARLQTLCISIVTPRFRFLYISLHPATTSCLLAKKIYNPLQPSLLGNGEQNTTHTHTDMLTLEVPAPGRDVFHRSDALTSVSKQRTHLVTPSEKETRRHVRLRSLSTKIAHRINYFVPSLLGADKINAYSGGQILLLVCFISEIIELMSIKYINANSSPEFVGVI